MQKIYSQKLVTPYFLRHPKFVEKEKSNEKD
jgi:hypothetical protein